jgi:hypothetical protein
MIWALILVLNSPGGLFGWNISGASVSGFESKEACDAAGKQVAALIPEHVKIGALWTCVLVKKG